MPQLGMTLEAIQALLGGGEIIGSPEFVCESVASLGRAGADQLSFVKDERYVETARASRAGALLVPSRIEGFEGHQLIVNDAYRAFGVLLSKIAEEQRRTPKGIHPRAEVDPRAEVGSDVTIGVGAVVREDTRIGDRCVIHAGAYVGQRSTLGADTTLYPGVVVLEDVSIGDRVLLHAGTVVGSDGYGFIQHEGRHLKIPQVGRVAIGDDVEIGALTTIDRATLDETVIGRGTKIGDLCHIAHNCRIGEDVLVLPTVAISGSVTVGDRAVFAGRSGCADNLTIGEGAVLGGTAVAFKDVPAGSSMWGNPARDKTLEMRIQAGMRRLPEMQRDLRAIKKKLDL
jgi:UDP-3-O-[3-hydroxymyristoyl] glucosamine N-acyltransferase